MSVASDVENGLRAAFVENCVSVAFSHLGAEAVTLAARVKSRSVEQVQRGGILDEERILTLAVAVQTGFAAPTDEAEPVSPGDLVTCQNREYEVLSPIESSSCGQVYELRCAERKRVRNG